MFLERMFETIARRVFWEQADSHYTRQVETTARRAAESAFHDLAMSDPLNRDITVRVTLDDGAHMPERAHPTDAGADLRCIEGFVVPPHGSVAFDTGVHIELPYGTVGMLKSKSGLNVKFRNVTEGVIDEGYTGSIQVCVYNHGDYPYEFQAGDKVTQLVVIPVFYARFVEVDEISGGDRGDSGFGSSGR